jgi:hypothetical protein
MGDRLQVNRYSRNNSRFSAKCNCNILKRSPAIISEAHNISEDGTTGASKFLQFVPIWLIINDRYTISFHFNSTRFQFKHYCPGHLQLHMYLGTGIT